MLPGRPGRGLVLVSYACCLAASAVPLQQHAGTPHTYALFPSCRGDGELGQLGDGRNGTGHATWQPVRVLGGHRFMALDAGDSHGAHWLAGVAVGHAAERVVACRARLGLPAAHSARRGLR